MTIDEYVKQRLETLKTEIVSNIETKGISASGRTARSFRVEVYDGGIRLVGGGDGAAPVNTLEVGRTGGGIPAGFTKILAQWSKDKGIAFETESKRNTFAYFLAKRIKEEGTLRNKQNTDVYSTAVQNAVEDIGWNLRIIIGEMIKTNF